MMPEHTLTRRRFPGLTAATAGTILTPGAPHLAAESIVPESGAGETPHFWYRLQPAGMYIDSQRNNKAFAYSDGKVFLSEDNSRTWPHSIAFPDARRIAFSRIIKNWNIVFATKSKLYLSTDNLKTYSLITLKDARGRDYLPHTPQNPENPGWYFSPLAGVNSWDVNGVEMLVWGNYWNVLGGASPVNIYYSRDGGRTGQGAGNQGRSGEDSRDDCRHSRLQRKMRP